MVEKVIGKNPNFEIIFYCIEGQRWEAELPPNLSGEYYIDLYAYDKAGNVGYMSKALFEVDTTNLCWHIKIIDYDVTVRFKNDYKCMIREVMPCAVKN